MNDLNEADLLRRIFVASRGLTQRFPRRVVIPPGDDMAAVRVDAGLLLTSIDQVIVGRHVTADTPWRLIGRKAVARNLSDIAAMAARPIACLASVALPPGATTEDAMELFEGLRTTGEAYDCPLIGGDTAICGGVGDPLVCSVVVLADTPPSRGPIRRAGAAVGDRVFVTGRLGGSFAPDGRGRHLSFAPRISEAIELVEALGSRLHAMIDLSDGVGRDGARLAEASGVALRIDAARLPCQDGCDWRAALSNGEDYELLFAAAGDVPNSLGRTPVTQIGEVEAVQVDGVRVLVDVDGRTIVGDELGWDHRPEQAGSEHARRERDHREKGGQPR